MFDYHLSKTLVDELLTAAGTSHTLKKGKLVAEQGKPLNKLILIRMVPYLLVTMWAMGVDYC